MVSSPDPAHRSLVPAHGGFSSVGKILLGLARAESYTVIRMQNTLATGMLQTAEGMRPTNRDVGLRPKMVLYSQVPGRERWYVQALEDNPRLAATVEAVLKSEEGILDARANPLTGRVLVKYQRGLFSESTDALINSALEFGPMSEAEFAVLRSKKAPSSHSFRHLLAAELGCCAINLILLGEFCPFVLGAVGLHLLMHRHA